LAFQAKPNNIHIRALIESVYKGTGVKQAIDQSIYAIKSSTGAQVEAQNAMIRGSSASINKLRTQANIIRRSKDFPEVNQLLAAQQKSLIESTRTAFAGSRQIGQKIGGLDISKGLFELRKKAISEQMSDRMAEEQRRMRSATLKQFREIGIGETDAEKYLSLRQKAKYDPSLSLESNKMWNRLLVESTKKGFVSPAKASIIGKTLKETESTELSTNILKLKKQEDSVNKSIATVTEKIVKLEEQRKSLLESAKTGQNALIVARKGILEGIKKERLDPVEQNIKKVIEHKNKHLRIAKAIRDQEKEQTTELRSQAQIGQDIASKWAGILTAVQAVGQALMNNLELTKQFREAIILSGVNYSEGAFKQTAFGMDIGQMGQVYKAIARSAFPKSFQGRESTLAMFESVFGVEPNQLVPMVGGMKSMFGKGISIDKIMQQMFATSATSSFDFSGWSSIAMQGAVPALEDLGVRMEQVSALLAGISNMGGGPFAAGFGLSGLSQLAAPSKKQQTILSQIGITDPSAFIRANGIIELLQTINDETAKMSATARDSAIKELFPSMTKGTSLMIMNNLNYFRELEKTYSNPFFQKAAQQKLELMPINQLKEVFALFRNIGAKFTEIIAGSWIFQGVFMTIKEILKGVLSVLEAINKNTVLKQLIGAAATIFSMIKLLGMIKTLFLDIGLLSKIFSLKSGAGILGGLIGGTAKTAAVSSAGPLGALLGASSPIMGVLAPLGIAVGGIAITLAAMKAFNERKAKEETIKLAEGYERLYKLSEKARTVGLTPEEERERARIIGSPFGKKAEHREWNIKIDVTGQTNPEHNDTLARRIREEFERELLPKAGQ
jgi:hypothetical protein